MSQETSVRIEQNMYNLLFNSNHISKGKHLIINFNRGPKQAPELQELALPQAQP